MKNKTYKFGRTHLKCRFANVGHGYEVSVTFDKKTIFVGNFIHQSEAARWWGMMNREILSFTRTFFWNAKVSKTFYGSFFSNTLYKTYYSFLDKMFTSHNKNYARAVSRDMKKYRTMKKSWSRTHVDKYILKSA